MELDTSNWVYIIMSMKNDEPEIHFVTQDEKKAYEFYACFKEENPMFFIKELDSDQA